MTASRIGGACYRKRTISETSSAHITYKCRAGSNAAVDNGRLHDSSNIALNLITRTVPLIYRFIFESNA